MSNVAKGRVGEKEAERFLKRNGYRIIERNYRCRFGEIDIVARDGNTLAFIEVKSTRSQGFGSPKAFVNTKKQGRIIRASLEYLGHHRLEDCPVRFDVVSIEFKDGSPHTELVKNAFDADD